MTLDATTAVLVDLDSTVCHTLHRQHLVPLIKEKKATWEEYALRCVGDTPIAGTVALLRLLWPHHQVHLVSGRGDVARSLTRQWLGRHRVPYDFLSLRGEKDFRPNPELKIEYIERLRERGVRAVLFLEDWGDAAAKIEVSTGVPVLGVDPFYPADSPHGAGVQTDTDGGGGGGY